MDTAVEIVDVHADTSQSGVSWAAIAAGAVANSRECSAGVK